VVFPQDFLDVLNERDESFKVADRISALACFIDNQRLGAEELDIVWSDGAIYNIGFEKGVAEWHRFLEGAGLLVASEITWLTDSRPAELQQHWDSEYSQPMQARFEGFLNRDGDSEEAQKLYPIKAQECRWLALLRMEIF
jgi:hypothetical protein